MHLGESGLRGPVLSPGLCFVPGNPPCTEMALSWVTVRASSRSGPTAVRGKDQDSAHDRWTVSEHPAEENPLELQASPQVTRPRAMVVCAASGTSSSSPGCSSLRSQGSPMASSPIDFSPVDHSAGILPQISLRGVAGCFLVGFIGPRRRSDSASASRLKVAGQSTSRFNAGGRPPRQDQLDRMAGSPPE